MSMSTRKDHQDDDGRTIADMSGIQRQPVFIPKIPKRPTAENGENAQKKENELFLTKKEKTAYILGTLRSALLIGAVFAAAFALLIILMLVIWGLQ